MFHRLGSRGLKTPQPAKYIPYIYNFVVTSERRGSCGSRHGLAKFGIARKTARNIYPEFQKSVAVHMPRFLDLDDEVTDQGGKEEVTGRYISVVHEPARRALLEASPDSRTQARFALGLDLARAAKMFGSARVRSKEMLLTEFLDDIASTVVSFRMVVFEPRSGGRRLENVAVAVWGQYLAMEKSRNG